jgi:TetR/AcrR family transcriptional regulator, tetracycline repressor protein
MSKNPESRSPLDRDIVLRTGLAIGDSEGLEAVSLRRSANELGVTPMALYRYVENKDALLDGLLDLAYGEVELPDPATTDWWEGLVSIANSARRVMAAHPAAAALVVSKPEAGPNAVRIIECILALLRRAGFGVEEAVQVQNTFTRFVLALISFETSLLPELNEEEREQKARRTRFEIESLPPAEYPNLIEAAPYVATPYDPDRNFSQALELLKAGIEAELRSSSR